SFRTDLSGKRLEILKEIAPRIRNVATFYNPDNPVTISRLNSTREAARRLGIVLIERQVHSGDELRASLETLKHADADALFPASEIGITFPSSLLLRADQVIQ